jgi:hypothetical protein
VLEGAPPGIGDDEHLRRTTASALAAGPRRTDLGQAVDEQRVQMAADGGGGEPEPFAEGGGGDGSVLQDEPGDTRTRAPLGGHAGEPHDGGLLGA